MAAEADLGETAERRSASLAELKQLVAENSGSSGLAPAGAIRALLAAIADTGLSQEEVLLQHLRARKFDVAKAFESLSLRAAFLQEYPDLSKDVAGLHVVSCCGCGGALLPRHPVIITLSVMHKSAAAAHGVHHINHQPSLLR